jgi:hypothetical protein
MHGVYVGPYHSLGFHLFVVHTRVCTRRNEISKYHLLYILQRIYDIEYITFRSFLTVASEPATFR